MATSHPSQLDHLILGAPSLRSGMKTIRDLFGIDAVEGGEHPGRGTKNALAGFESNTYLEILAPNDEPADSSVASAYLHRMEAPALTWWCARCADLRATMDRLEAKGIGEPALIEAERATPSGEILRWELLLLRDKRLKAGAPFLINWLDTPHPSLDIPSLGTVSSFSIHHPEPALLQDCLDTINYVDAVSVSKGEQISLTAFVESQNGFHVELKSSSQEAPAVA